MTDRESVMKAVREYIASDADIGLKNDKGKTALDIARKKEHGEIVLLLEKAMAGKNKR